MEMSFALGLTQLGLCFGLCLCLEATRPYPCTDRDVLESRKRLRRSFKCSYLAEEEELSGISDRENAAYFPRFPSSWSRVRIPSPAPNVNHREIMLYAPRCFFLPLIIPGSGVHVGVHADALLTCSGSLCVHRVG